MTKKCFVPECKSGYKTCKEKVSLFRAPPNEAVLQQWQNAVAREDRAISRNDHVCEKHFQEEDIIRYWVYQDIKDKLQTPRLKKNAVPSIFPPKSLASDKPVNKKKSSKRNKNKNKNSQPDNDPLVNEAIENFEPLDDLSKSNIFTSLWNNELVLTVPSSSWALHKVESCNSKLIIVSDVIIANNVPSYQKQIVLNDDETVSIIIGTSIISEQEQIKYFGNPIGLHCLEDLNMLINTLHTSVLNLDSSGSEINEYYEILN